jgi:TRAP-type C4-dicarboxylate transport system permease small subunit
MPMSDRSDSPLAGGGTKGDTGETSIGVSAKIRALSKSIFALNRGIGYSVGFITCGLAFMVGYDVFMRYVFNAPTIWVTEIATYTMGYITFVGASYGLQTGSHVQVDILTTRVSVKVRRIFSVIASLINLVVMAVLGWESFFFWWSAVKSGEESWGLLSVPLRIPYFFFFGGMAWLFVIQLALIPKTIRGEQV